MDLIHTDTVRLQDAPKRRRNGKPKSFISFRKNAELFLLCVPGLVAYILFNYVPMAGIVMAFKKFNYSGGIFGSKWIGLKNFEFLLISSDVGRIVRNTVAYGLCFLVLGIIFNAGIALLLSEINSRKAIKTFQTCITLPNFLSWVVIGFITYSIFHPSLGIMNQVLNSLGLAQVDVYSNAKYWPFILTYVHMWKVVGMGSLMLYASLMGIDVSLYEAAKIDGANRWQKTKYISIPHLVPLVCIFGILGMGSIFEGDFGLFYQISRNIPTLYETTDVISTYVFRGLTESSYGVTSAVGFAQSILGLLMVLFANLVVKKISPENSMF